MKPEKGKYVMYRMSELCRIEGFETKCPDGKTARDYCVLSPLNSRSTRYYIPAESAPDKLRELLTREEILGIIHGMGDAEEWVSNPIERRQQQGEIMSGGDYLRIAAMLRGIYIEKQRREKQGKHLNATDERTMKAAEDMINGEFSFVLGIPLEEVPEFIRRELQFNAAPNIS